MSTLVIMLVCISAVVAAPSGPERIAGGAETTICEHPYAAVLLYSISEISFTQNCAGTVLSPNAILTAASCVSAEKMRSWRIRVGSGFASSGGSVHYIATVIQHPTYDVWTRQANIAILRPTPLFVNFAVSPAIIAGPMHQIPVSTALWAIGWGAITNNGVMSEQMRRVSVSVVAIAGCRNNYANAPIPFFVDEYSMFCAGNTARDQCQGDTGGPLIQNNNMVVGVTSVRDSCAQANFPGINTLVAPFSAWIQMHM